MAPRRRRQYEVERIVAQRCCRKRGGRTEYRVRWRGWSAADDTWEPAATLEREVPAVVRSFLKRCLPRTESVGKRCRARAPHTAAPLLDAYARAKLPSSSHSELYALMRRQFPATSPHDTAQIIRESQCLLTLSHMRGAVIAGACCSYDDDDTDDPHGRLGYLHFLASDVKGQKHGTTLLHAAACFLKQRGVKQLRLDAQQPDSCMDASGRSRNDPVAFYVACGCIKTAQSSVAIPCQRSIPMEGDIDRIIVQCSRKLGSAQPEEVRLVPPIYTGPNLVHGRVPTAT